MSWILALILAASVIGGGGLAYAADGAAPGDALYGLDRAMERVRLNLTTDTVESIELRLAFAEERALEVGQTAGHAEPAHLGQALDNYGDTIAAVARGVALVEGPARATPEAQLTQALAVHDRVLQRVFDDEEDVDPAQEQVRDQERSDWCTEETDGAEHPAAGMIADRYEVGYEQIMIWFCEGAGFGEIMLAIRICEGTVPCVADLFSDRDDGLGWGQIMQDPDLIGGPERVGPPEDAGQPGDRPVGPPDDQDVGKPDDTPVGPPEGAGQPGDRPVGPPEGEDVGQPGDGPGGPPDDAGPTDDGAAGPPVDVSPPPPAGGEPPDPPPPGGRGAGS